MSVTLSVAFSSVAFEYAIAQDRAGSKTPGRQVPAKTASAPTPAPTNPPRNPNEADTGPAIVATVNGQPITLQQLAEQCVVRHGEDMIENMVNRYLILQSCQQKGIVIKTEDVNAEIARTASKFNLSMTQYLKLIEDERKIAPEQYASDIVWPMLALRSLAKDKIQVSPKEIDEAYQSEFGPKVQVRMLAIKDPKKMSELHAQVAANPDTFKTIAKNHSEDPQSASVEGLLPPIRHFTGDDELEQIAFALKPGQVSKVFPAGDMQVCLQCVRHLPPTNAPAAQMQEIQGRIRSELEDAKLRGAAEAVYTEMRTNSKVVTVLGHPELQQQYPGVAAIVNNQSVTMAQLEKECVKRYGTKVLEGEINRKLIEDNLTKARLQVAQPEIDAEIAHTADYFGFIKGDGTPDVQAWLTNVTNEDGKTVELYVRDVVWPTVALKKLIADRIKVTDEDLKKGFEANYGTRAEVLAIVLSNQRIAQQVWELARNTPTEQFFGELANQYSVEPSSRSNFGKVPPLRRHGGQPTLEKAAFDLKPTEMSGIIEVGGQYVILKSQGFTSPVVQDFNAVQGELYKDILEKKQRLEMDNYMSELLRQSQIANFLDSKKSRVSASETQASLDELKRSEAKR